MKKVLYTAVFGGYDKVSPVPGNEDWERVLFTERTTKVEGWETRRIKLHMGDILKNRLLKLKPYNFIDYDVSIYIDGNIEVVGDLDEYLDFMGQNRLMMFNHNSTIGDARKCAYLEAWACIQRNKWIRNEIVSQMIHYMDDKYPANNGLVCGGVIARKSGKKIEELMSYWWNQLTLFTPRDQLSFNYSVWKTKANFKYFNEDIRDNKYFKIKSHEHPDSR